MRNLKNECVRELEESKKLLLTLFFLFLLGTSLFIGGQAIYPNMLKTANNYYQTYHLPDTTVKSDAGFTSEDYTTIKQKAKLTTSYLGYSEFAISDYKQQVTLIRSISESNTQQQKAPYQLKQGTFPRKSGEIALDQKMATIYPLGSKITFIDDLNQQTKKQLKRTTYQVVGFVSSPEFIQTSVRGYSPIGNGEIAFISVILEKDFNLSNKNNLVLTYQATKNKVHYQNPYQQKLFEQTKQTRTTMNQLGIQKMEEAKEALLTKQVDIDEKISDLTAELDNQKMEVSDSEKIITEQKTALEAEKKELSQQLTTLENELISAQATFQQNEQLLTAKIQEVETMTTAIEESETLMAENQNNLEEFTQLVETNQEQLATYQDSLDNDYKKIKQIQNPTQQKDAQQKYDARLKKYQTEQTKVATQLNQLETAKTQFATNEATLSQQNDLLNTALDQLSQLEENFTDSESDYETKLFEKEDIQQSQNELTTTDSEMIADDEQNLAELKETLTQQKAALEAEIKKETSEKNQVDKQIKQMKPPTFSIDHSIENTGYVAYQKELSRLKYMTQILPFIVYGLTLILALVLIVNALRKKRQHSYILKVLGIHPFTIFVPTLLLSTSIALIGLIAGCFIGTYGIPTAVFKLYQKSYLIDHYQFILNYQRLAIALGLTLLTCILPIFYYSVAPFHKKTTKSIHLIGTLVIPITFVVALLFVGMNTLQTVQDNFLNEYPTTLEVKLHTSQNKINNHDYLKILHYYSIKPPSLIHKEDIRLANASSLSLIVPKEKTSIADSLPTKGAALTEKTAANQRLKVGDAIIFYDTRGEKHSLIIEKILKTEQEALYLSATSYEDVFTKQSTFDTLLLALPETLNQTIGTHLLDLDTVEFKGLLYERLEKSAQLSTPTEANNRLATLLLGLPSVTEVHPVNNALQNESFKSLRKLISVFVLIAICLTALTLYSSFYIQLAKQAKESQILNALGFEKQKINASILRKSYPFILIGCFLGGIFGMVLYTLISKKLLLSLPISFSIMNYIWTLLIVFLFSICVIKSLNKSPFNLNKLRATIQNFFLNYL